MTVPGHLYSYAEQTPNTMCQQTHPNVNMGFTREQFPAGTHICLIFNDDAERKKIIAKYLEQGLEDGERVLYFADTMSLEDVQPWLVEMGVSLQPDMLRQQLITQQALSAYCPTGEFVPDAVYDRLRDGYLESKETGFSGARVSGEMSWALQDVPGKERLMEYEATVNNVLAVYPMTAICQYDANLFDGLTLLNVLKVHPMMIVHGQIVRNPYYMKPEDFLNQWKQ